MPRGWMDGAWEDLKPKWLRTIGRRESIQGPRAVPGIDSLSPDRPCAVGKRDHLSEGLFRRMGQAGPATLTGASGPNPAWENPAGRDEEGGSRDSPASPDRIKPVGVGATPHPSGSPRMGARTPPPKRRSLPWPPNAVHLPPKGLCKGALAQRDSHGQLWGLGLSCFALACW